MNHAAQCGYCGPLLKAAARNLSDEATPDEEAVLAKLGSARPEWQASLARTLRNADVPPKEETVPAFWKRLFYWPRSAFAGAALAAVVVVAGWLVSRALRPQSAEELLAQAYTEHRTIEVRIPGAKYAPLRVERGNAGSNFNKPEPLLKAEALIGERLRQNPNDPKWLQARARADLLDSSYDDAIKTLQRALESDPESPILLTDLGSAYFLRGRSADRPIDYGNAIESFGRALAKNPGEPIALFNRALACQQIYLYTQAIDDWEQYLRIDPQGEWADEARKHLAAVKEKVKNRDQSRSEPLVDLSRMTEARNEPFASKIDQRIEEYLFLAATRGLPSAFFTHAKKDSDASAQIRGLKMLANLAFERHHDLWLTDLLAGHTAADFHTALTELSEAILAIERADSDEAKLKASRAVSLFAHSNNAAGLLRAQVELLTALNWNGDGAGCESAVQSLQDTVRKHSYPWLLGRFELEAGDCAWLREDLGSASSRYRFARNDAKAHGFQGIYLRAQDRLAGLDAAIGSFDSAWEKSSQGLATFWFGNFPDVRGYNFYFAIYEITRVTGLPRTQVAAWRDGLRLTESSPDITQRAMAHLAMGNAAEKAAMPALSATEFARADELFAQAPQIHSTRLARFEAAIRLARVEVSQGNTRQAIARMKPLQLEVDDLPNNYLAILFYATLGEAEGVQAEWVDAEKDLWKAISLAQGQVRSLKDPRSRWQAVRESSDAYRLLVQRELLKGHPARALNLWESYKAAPLGSKRSNVSTELGDLAPEDGLPRYLPALGKQTVLSYAFLPKGLAIWVADDRGVSSHWEEGRNAEIIATAARLRELCADPNSDPVDLRRNAQVIYQALIAPIRNRIGTDRMLLAELDDGLDDLPLEVLMDEQGRYLGDIFLVSTSLGIYYRDESRTISPISADMPALVVGVPNASTELGKELPPLPGVLTEAEAVNHSFSNGTLLKGGEATRESVVSRLPGMKLFHFAGHAIHTPSQSGILLTDAVLGPRSIQIGQISELQLAVFSACETQYGLSGAINDADSLVRVLLQAGVPSVVASRWTVDSMATRQLMELFYRALLDGNSVSSSIHRAEAELRSRHGTSHPYYWAAFGAFGVS